MAVDVYATSEVSASPRISFSHDLNDPSSEFNSNSTDPTRSDQLLLSPTFDFDFRTTSNLTPADELFSNGKILPTQIKKPDFIQNPETKSKSNNSKIDSQKKLLKELIEDQDPDQEPDQEPVISVLKSFWQFRRSASLSRDNGNCPKGLPRSLSDQENEKSLLRSFWQFRRSASLNSDNGKGPKGLLRSLSIKKSLARSNSTGSALNPKRSSGQKVVEKTKDPMLLRRCASLNQPHPPPSSHVYYRYHNSNRSCKEGVRIIPVLNIPPAYDISKGTINFFGFGFFCNGKVRKKTKS